MRLEFTYTDNDDLIYDRLPALLTNYPFILLYMSVQKTYVNMYTTISKRDLSFILSHIEFTFRQSRSHRRHSRHHQYTRCFVTN